MSEKYLLTFFVILFFFNCKKYFNINFFYQINLNLVKFNLKQELPTPLSRVCDGARSY